MAVIGYEELLLEVDGEYDYYARSYHFRPINESKRGMMTTAAVRLCRKCNALISSMGGPGYRSYCPSCYDLLKLQDFAEGHQHTIRTL